jgi:hypothetical protein
MTVLLDPTAEQSPALRPRLPRPQRLDERLRQRGLVVKRYRKPTNTRPAPLPLRQQIATETDIVIEGLSD